MEKNKVYSFIVAACFLSAAAGGLVGSKVTLSRMNMASPKPAVQDVAGQQKTVYVEESQLIDTVDKVSPSVVSIVISKDLPLYRQGVRQFDFNQFFNDPFEFNMPFEEPQRDANGNIKKEKRQIGGGSGFIISDDGLVVTNRHVVEDDEAEYTVVTNDGKEFPAQILAKDTLNDFAVLKLMDNEENKVKDLPFVELGDSASLKIGQKVLAIGNALAEYQNTVTTGIISGKGRSIAAGSMQGNESLINLIQTDAAINPGNSGGPLVNLEGQVIGINTAIADGAEGIGFALPIDDVKSLITSVEENGKIVRPYLGVRFMMLDAAKAKELKIDVENGALLVGDEANGEFAVIPGSPADKAGLQIKDVIQEINGEEVNLDNPLHVMINKYQPGDTVKLKVWRSGEVKEISVKLSEPS